MIDTLSGVAEISVFICTGNSIDSIAYTFENSVHVFADRGLNHYVCSNGSKEFIGCLDSSKILNRDDIDYLVRELKNAGIDPEKISVRDNSIIAIKPIAKEYKESIKCLIEYIVHYSNIKDLAVKFAGKTTIEISHVELNKSIVTETLLKDTVFYYIGDEPYGNDYEIMSCKNAIVCTVEDVKDTNSLLKTLCETYL